MARVAVVGSINMDLVVRAPRFPVAGETILGQVFADHPGRQRRQSGGRGAAPRRGRRHDRPRRRGRLWRRATGEPGPRGHRNRRRGVDPARATGVALITVEDSGENTIIVVPGANGALTPADLDAARALLTGAASLLMQLEIPLDVVQAAAEMARAAGVTVILNAAPAQPLPPRLLARVDYLVVNEVEARLLAGADGAGPVDAARALLALGARHVVVTLGEAGSLLVGPDGGVVAAPAFPVHAVDTTAAGDGFVGAFAVALAAGQSGPEALRWGNAAGALAVTREGAQPSLPTRAELEAFLTSRAQETSQ